MSNQLLNPSPFHSNLTDVQQTSWQMASIQLAAMLSLPSLTASIILITKYTFFVSLINILLGYFILWVIRYGLIKISFKNRKSTLDISNDYFGKTASYFIALALLLNTIAWFFFHTSIAGNIFVSLFSFNYLPDTDKFIQVSVLIGIVSTLLCIPGMKCLKILAIIVLPILVLMFLGLLLLSPLPLIHQEKMLLGNFSFSGLGLILGSNLGFSVDIPTFFRHRRSWKDSRNALTIVQLIGLLVCIGGLFIGEIISINLKTDDFLIGSINITQRYLLAGFVLLSAVYANFFNVYSSSVGWEALALLAKNISKSLVGPQEYTILGFSISSIFIICAFFPMYYLNNFLNFTDSSMINLSLIFFWSFLTYLTLHKPPNNLDKKIYFISWVLSTILCIYQIIYFGFISNIVLFTPILMLLLVFLGKILFSLIRKVF